MIDLTLSQEEADQLADDLFLAAAMLDNSHHQGDSDRAERLRNLAHRLL